MGRGKRGRLCRVTTEFIGNNLSFLGKYEKNSSEWLSIAEGLRAGRAGRGRWSEELVRGKRREGVNEQGADDVLDWIMSSHRGGP